MVAHVHTITFDSADPEKLGRFWAQATGYGDDPASDPEETGEHAHDEPEAQPFGSVVPVDECRDDGSHDEAAGEVDRERAPGEESERAGLDRAVDEVAGEGAERAAGGNGKLSGHGTAPFGL